MDLHDLIIALLAGDALFARQWVADAARAQVAWDRIAAPVGLDPSGMAVAAGIVEMLAERAGHVPPSWTASVPPAPEPVFLVRAARSMPRLRQSCEENGPLGLRRRRILAPADFLTAA
jgi:hypothetical protein